MYTQEDGLASVAPPPPEVIDTTQKRLVLAQLLLE